LGALARRLNGEASFTAADGKTALRLRLPW
jgi:hypothetical protein